ncbi:discoidin domain-containing protein [Microbacterium sulfonylureivorans]|uniref:discoidin domain-containing protein n=1 Tax=Microbacterium sulfonylureivorans TaxID=2486854 RepID=UPI0013E0D8F5|nr:discoidin domain-containing protein [Microbacterium sulfonylureivorans]
MAEWWDGDAQWTFVRKNVAGENSLQLYGSMVEVMPDGTWYLFNRQMVYNTPGCSLALDVQVRKSTDKGASWSAPVTIITHTPGTEWSCMASDGDAYYNQTEDRWHYIFQCLGASGAWRTCELGRDGADPMGEFTIAPPGGNPLFARGDLWRAICTSATANCSVLAGGPGNATEEGTFEIIEYDEEGYYWVSFHGYDKYGSTDGWPTHFYRGVAKTQDFDTWIAGDPSKGTPADAIHSPYDIAGWRETWIGGTQGPGAGSMIKEDGMYYNFVEAADNGMNCDTDKHWDWGAFRSTTLNNNDWDQFPDGNPIMYSSTAGDGAGGTQTPCNLTYLNVFKDPTDGFYYLAANRGSHIPANLNVGNDGMYWYRLEKSTNVLSNADLWKADTSGWTPWNSAVTISAQRDPYGSPNGGQYMKVSCGASCATGNSVYQDADVTGGGSLTFGGKAKNVESGAGSVTYAVFQFNSSGTKTQTDPLVVPTTTNWGSSSKKIALRSDTVKIRYQVYLADSKTYRLTDLVAQTSATTDTTDPSGVLDLRATANGSGTTTLNWTSAGDDGHVGTAASYEVRYSTSPITASNWSTASLATGAPTPVSGGSPQSMQITGLTSTANYYYAIKATDPAGNAASISNVATTVGATLYTDNFGTLGGAWATKGGAWSVNGNVVSQTETMTGDPKKLVLSNSGITYPDNVTVSAKVRVDSWSTDPWARAGIGLLTDPATGNGYSLALIGNKDKIAFVDDGVTAGPQYTFAWTEDTWYRFKLRMDSGALYAKVWQDGTTEPEKWQFFWDRRGRAGVPALVGGSATPTGTSNTTSFSDFRVSYNAVTDYRPDLAVGRQSVTSSGVWQNSSLFQPVNVTDSSESSRWASNTTGATWIQVDLGSSQSVRQVNARWETGGSYTVQVSTDGTNYTTVRNSTIPTGLTSTDTFNPTTARYVRISAPGYRSIYSVNIF